jgi:glycine cleavage system H protein
MWYEPIDGGLIRVGMTMVGPALADYRIFAFTPKRVGRALEAQKSCATIESSKWVGPARIAFDGVVEAVNEDLIDRPGQLATDPYGGAWMLIARPTRADALAGLVTGEAMVDAYTRWLDENDFAGCFRVSD